MDFIKDFNIDKVRNLAEDVYNQHKPKTDLEAKIYEVLSHKNWGSSSTLLNELAQDTYDYDKFPVIIKLMWEGMNNRPAAWRVVFKSLTLLEHLVKNGSERCVDDAQGHKHFLKGLHNFNYYEGTIDRGIGVREKSKQIVELLSDDERVREERQKAKQLREKFGGSMRGVSSEGGSSGGGYGGDFSSSSSSGRYAGYGKDSMQSGGGYGNSGIGSHTSYNDNSSSAADRGYSGRYSDTTSSNVTPTFATLPEQGESSKEPSSKPKKSKKKKKKDKTSQAVAPVAPAPAAPAVDLFSFDDNSPAPAAAAAAEDDFGAFDSAPNTKTSAAAADVDPFGDFSSSSSPSQPAISNTTTAPVAFDAFSSESKPAAVTAFDAFGTSGNSGSTSNNDPFATNNTNSAPSMMSSMNNMSSMNSSSGVGMMNMGMNSMGGGMSSNIMGGGSSQQKPPIATAAGEDDDFGDFAEADNKTKGDDVLSNDPYSKLIGLDGLKKNIKKGDKANEPILFNAVAKSAFDMNQKQNNNEMMPTMDPALSFSGIDGLQKQLDVSHNRSNISNRQPGQPVMMSITGGVAGGMNSLNSGMAAMSMGGGMNQQSMMGGNNMRNMGMRNNNMMGGSGMGMSMNSMQQQQSMMGGMMGGGMNMGMNNNNNMMGGGMNGMGMGSMNMGGMNQNQQQSNNSNMMGGGMGTTMGTMGNQAMGGGQAGNGQMGGMPMDGWR